MANYLIHFGIKGQKWGVRRYQNPDGTLTAEGKARYRTEENLVGSMIKKMAGPDDYIDGQYSKYIKDPKFKQKWDKNAELGLKALPKISLYNTGDFDPSSSDDREWFLFEDQTIGLPEIANFVNKGYSLDKINNLIDAIGSSNLYYGEDFKNDETSRNILFAIDEGGDSSTLKKFAEICKNIKDDEERDEYLNLLGRN